jgi:hypothetical protein
MENWGHKNPEFPRIGKFGMAYVAGFLMIKGKQGA